MKVTAVATEQITEIDGVTARVWKGTTENGVEFIMFVARVAVHKDADPAEFERELKSIPPPRITPLAHVFDPRMF